MELIEKVEQFNMVELVPLSDFQTSHQQPTLNLIKYLMSCTIGATTRVLWTVLVLCEFYEPRQYKFFKLGEINFQQHSISS